MTLWSTNSQKSSLTQLVNHFTVGEDYLLDQHILPYDVQASKVHAQALQKMNLLTQEEVQTIHTGLDEILDFHTKGDFLITIQQEDCHTAIEQYLTEKHGEVGKKIHTARSRNDQVLTAIRLWQKAQLNQIQTQVINLTRAFQSFAKAHKNIEMPGYTHTQRAMPTTLGAWAGAYAEMLQQTQPLLSAALTNINQCPLGSAAGFGTNFPYPRDWVAEKLGFEKALTVVNTAQNTRTKIDLDFLYALLRVGQVLSHFASELVLFTSSEFNFLSVTDALTTGSSIMPQKKNLDPAELIRGRYATLWGHFSTVQQLGLNLCSGYHRDFQLGKKPLIESTTCVQESLDMAEALIQNIKPNKKKIQAACTPELYATAKVNELVMEGMSFRDAYREVKKQL